LIAPGSCGASSRSHAGDLAWAKWIDPASRYRELLEPDADTLELVQVSSLVNSVKNDGPECAVRVA
jgi:putative SOS response-associated peptidase YedK